MPDRFENNVALVTGAGSGIGRASAPARFPVMPVIKMSGNPDGYEKRKDLIDIYVGSVIEAGETIDHAGERLLQKMVSVASGQKQTIYEKGTYEEALFIQIDGPSL